MQAIETKFLPATNRFPSRIKAWCERGSITIGYPHEISGEDNCHRAAALALIRKFVDEDYKHKPSTLPEANPWNRPFVTGGLPGKGYAHVYSGFNCAEIVQVSNEEDKANFQRYVETARATDGTVSGVRAGIGCATLKRSKPTAI
jgi:hypothetical protein